VQDLDPEKHVVHKGLALYRSKGGIEVAFAREVQIEVN
jgi:hypothetical protein